MRSSIRIGWAAMESVALGVLVVLAVWALPAVASTPDAEIHCVVEVVGEEESGEFVTRPARCYPSFSEAMLDASDGRLLLPPDATGDVLFTDAQVAALASSFTLGVHYEGRNGTGDSVSVVGDDCSGGWWNTGDTWADRISSTWNGCYHLIHYSDPDMKGDTYDTYGEGDLDNIYGDMDDNTESVQYLSS